MLFRKTLHPEPLVVTVTLHGLVRSALAATATPTATPIRAESAAVLLDERPLPLHQRPSSGYDVFDATEMVGRLATGPRAAVGFQLRYTDERGSLVLHEALTQSLYALGRGSASEPLLVVYHVHPRTIHKIQRPRRPLPPTPPALN